MSSAATLLAHVGQGIDGLWEGFVHPITGTDHLLAIVAVGILGALVGHRRLAWVTPGAFVAGMIVGGVLGLSGFGVGSVEVMIAGSVVALGGLIAGTYSTSRGVWSWIPAVALGFGLIHGIAHGGEVPASASPLVYVVGFVSATIVLHLAGTAIGTTVGRHPVLRAGVGGLISSAGVAILVGLS